MIHTILKTLSYNPHRKVQTASIIWFVLAAIAVIAELSRHSINNYLIFKNVFWHTLHHENLYAFYPDQYDDNNHYGPVFSLLILPFAILPDSLGVFCWVMANAAFLFYAIRRLPISENQKNVILLISCVELMTSSHNVQFNPILAGSVILAFVLIQEQNEFMATLLIAIGILVKLYGVIGIIFILFSDNKRSFILYFILWMIVLFCLPMLISSPAFIAQSYVDWANALVDKNAMNIKLDAYGTDISVMGFLRRSLQLKNMSSLVVLIPASILILIPLLRKELFNNVKFRLSYLSLALISVVIFSSSSESPTYIIAVAGVAIWYACILEPNSLFNISALALVIMLTSFSTTDLFPPYIKAHWIKPFSIKVLPCFFIWLSLVFKLLLGRYNFDFSNSYHETKNSQYNYTGLQ